MSSNAPDESCLYPYSSGIGAEGVLGQGDTKDSAAFSPVHGVKSPVMVACGPHNTMFVDTKNKIYVCGLSQSKKDKSSIACSSVSEKPNDGEDDFQSFNLVVPICLRAPQFMDFKVAQISLGSYHALLLTTTGIVYAWGSSADGQLGLGTNISSSFPERVGGLSCVKQINCGVKFSAAVTDWGELYMWGENTYHQLGTGDSLSRYSPTLIKYLK